MFVVKPDDTLLSDSLYRYFMKQAVIHFATTKLKKKQNTSEYVKQNEHEEESWGHVLLY